MSLKAASSKRSITPKEDFLLCGYFPPKMSTGVHDEIYMTAIMFQTQETLAIWIGLDICVMTDEIYDGIIKAVQEQMDIHREHIIVSVSHNHTSPLVFAFPDFVAEERIIEKEKSYCEYLCKRASEIVVECKENLVLVKTYLGSCQIKGYYSNRNGVTKPADKRVSLIQFKDEQEKLVAQWLNMACHSTVLGPDTTEISADLLGNICKMIERETGVYPLGVNGCCGDSSTRQYRKGNDFTELMRVVTGIGEQILAIDKFIEIDIYKFIVEDVVQEISYDMNHEKLEQEVEDVQKKLKNAKKFDEIKILNSIINAIKYKLKKRHVDMTIVAHIIRMGDLEWVTFPGELVACLGLNILNEQTNKHRLIAGYVNQYIGYIVEKEEYGKNYESLSSMIPIGEPEKFIKKIIRAL